jgi:hypothetical protein
MSRARAKKKQRRRARAEGAGGASAQTARAERAERAERRASARTAVAGTAKTPNRPSRLQERDGIARPDAIWAPVPLTEIGIAAGIVVLVVGFATANAARLAIGVVMLTVVVCELCLREHFAGFRSHSLLLGLLPVTTVHMLIVLLVTTDWRGPLVLLVDLTAAGGLAWWLQRRFRVAQARALKRG